MGNVQAMTLVGVQLHPQHCSMDELRSAWKAADSAGLDSIWTWDHFFPLYGEPDGDHFEGWSLLAAMAADTEQAKLGLLVSCNSYRNPEMAADMTRTIDHISGGRVYFGIGSGWFERDYTEYGFDFGTAGGRLTDLAEALPRIRTRLDSLKPGPAGDLPILIGGGGEKRTLKYTAQFADAHNTFGPPDVFAHKMSVLDAWCEEIGRDPREIERTVAIDSSKEQLAWADDLVAAGATHIIVMMGAPFDLDPVLALQARLA